MPSTNIFHAVCILHQNESGSSAHISTNHDTLHHHGKHGAVGYPALIGAHSTGRVHGSFLSKVRTLSAPVVRIQNSKTAAMPAATRSTWIRSAGSVWISPRRRWIGATPATGDKVSGNWVLSGCGYSLQTSSRYRRWSLTTGPTPSQSP